MNVLMIGLPFTGHINPSLGLSKAFIDGGHNVTFILTDYWKEAVIKTGAQFVSYDKFPDNPTSFDLRRLSFKAAYDTALRVGKGFDVVIYDVLFFLGKNLSDKLKLPAIRLFSTFALNDALLEQIVDTGGPLMGLFKSKAIRKAITEKIIGDIALNNDDLLSEITHNAPCLNFTFTTREFQIDSDCFPDKNFKFIGPSITERDSDCNIAFESLTRPIIYISLGTMLNNARTFYNRCIKAFKDENVSVIMSIGKKVNIGELGNIPSDFMIYPFVPQLQVLENADLFITHGGMNSVNEAIYYGVPMLVMPLATDQPTIADRIVELNLGKKFNNKSPSVEDIRSQAMSVILDKSIIEQTHKFQSFSRQARGTHYAVIEAERYVKHRQAIKKRNQEDRYSR